jgi:hypothetical protein
VRAELVEEQQKAVDKLDNGKILVGGTGSGKSIVSLAYFVSKVCGGTYNDWGSMTAPRDVYVITTAKKRDALDWDKEAMRFGIGREREASRSGVKLTVDSWNNINKYKEVKDAFFIFDEQRLVGSGAWTKAFIGIAKHNPWILLSATPGDTWLDYIPVFVANGFYKNRTEFKREHVVYNTFSKYPKVDRYINPGRLVKLRNQLLVPMPMKRHTIRHCMDFKVDYDKELFDKVVEKRWHVFEKRPLRDIAELFVVMRKVVNTDSSRLTGVRTLLESRPRMIVFYNFDYELEELRKLSGTSMQTSLCSPEMSETVEEPSTGTRTQTEPELKSPLRTLVHPSSTSSVPSTSKLSSMSTSESTFTVAEWNGHRHDPLPTGDHWVYLVQYAAGSEGWNCTTTDTVVFYSQTYSYKHHHQAHGRIDRMNTPFTDLYYFYLISDSMIDRAIRKALKMKKSFNESSLGLKVA